MFIHPFLTDQSGAVVVDWVVMTAGVAGLALASMAVISGGTEDLSTGIDASLSGVTIEDEFDFSFDPVDLLAMDFSNGAPGWTGGAARDMGGTLGDLLVLGAGQDTEMTIPIPAGASAATLSFTLVGGDSLDGEPATMTLNGQTFLVANGNHGAMTLTGHDVPGMTVETTTTTERAQLGGSINPPWTESLTTVTVTVDNPGDALTFGMQSDTNQSIQDEFYGIDDVLVSAR